MGTVDGHRKMEYFLIISIPRAIETLKKNTPSFSDFVFTFNGKTPYYERKMREIWADACNKAGVKIHLYNAFRHSCASQLLDAGVELSLVQDIMGHTSQKTTRRYAKRNPAQITAALESRGKIISLEAFQRQKTDDESM